VSAAQGIAKTLQGAEKAVVKGGIDALDKIGQNVGTRTVGSEGTEYVAAQLFKKLGVKAGAALTVPYLGEVLLAIDVITTLWQAIEESNKDNVYQIWVKLSGLSNVK